MTDILQGLILVSQITIRCSVTLNETEEDDGRSGGELGYPTQGFL